MSVWNCRRGAREAVRWMSSSAADPAVTWATVQTTCRHMGSLRCPGAAIATGRRRGGQAADSLGCVSVVGPPQPGIAAPRMVEP
jgi:hypothetical protein